MRDVLVALLNRMSREDAARVLGCNANTVERWLAANALSFERTYTVRSLSSGAPASISATVCAGIEAALQREREATASAQAKAPKVEAPA